MTPHLNAPSKTQLGHDELRRRTHGLGQRHRTILLLIDGRRPLSKVLSLSLQAGAQTSHFEELVRLGLVDVPFTSMAPEPRDTSAGGLDVLRVTSVEMEVTDEPGKAAELALEAPRQEAPESVQPPTLPLADVVEPAEPATPAPRRHRAAVRSEPRYVSSVALPVLRAEIKIPSLPAASTPELRAPSVDPVAVSVADSLPVPAEDGDSDDNGATGSDAWLQHVRDLLIDTLRIDAPLFSARIFVRVRGAQSARELITVVWEIERHLSHTRHSRNELISLQRARDLLGLGNTLVAGDTQSGSDET